MYDNHGTLISKGCKNIQLLLDQLAGDYALSSFLFTGNGAVLHREKIATSLGAVIFQEPLIPGSGISVTEPLKYLLKMTFLTPILLLRTRIIQLF
jgi:hypothetical protein